MKKKVPKILSFFKQTFLRNVVQTMRRGNGAGSIWIDRFKARAYARRGIQDKYGEFTVFSQIMNAVDKKKNKYDPLKVVRHSQQSWDVKFKGEKGVDAGGLTR